MNNFRRDSFRRDSGSRGPRREMFDAVCDNCGKACKVPFRPTGDKPVYCSDCFEKMGGREGGRSDRRPRRRDFGGRDSAGSPRNAVNDQAILQLSKNIESLNTKLDKIITLLPSSEKKEKPGPAKVEKKAAKKAKTSKTKSTKAKKKE